MVRPLPSPSKSNLTRNPLTRAVIKTATAPLERSALQREYQTYQNQFVAESPFIRSLHEGVGDIASLDAAHVIGVVPPCLVLEWMDTEFRLIPRSFRSGEFPKHVARAVLKALWVLYYIDSTHTGILPPPPNYRFR